MDGEGEREGLLEAVELGLLLYPRVGEIEDVSVLRVIVEALKAADSLESTTAFYQAVARDRAV